MLAHATQTRLAPQALQLPECVSQPNAWFVAQTVPTAEAKAQAKLLDKGFRTYCPRYSVRMRNRRWVHAVRTVIRPLFAGYIFVADMGPPWPAILDCYGYVRRLLGSPDNPARLSNAQISFLKASEDERLYPARDSLWRPGAPACLAYGPFAGQDVVVTSIRTNRATVGMLMLGGWREVACHLDCLAPRDA